MNFKIFALIAVLAILLCGCGNTNTPSQTNPDGSVTPTVTESNTDPATDPGNIDDITLPTGNWGSIDLPTDEFDDTPVITPVTKPNTEPTIQVTEPPATEPAVTQPNYGYGDDLPTDYFE